MDIYEKYGANIFYITDDTFTASKKRCLEFCEMLRQSGISFVWGCESRADVINEECKSFKRYLAKFLFIPKRKKSNCF